MATTTVTEDMHDPLQTQWTDEQESTLLRAIIRFKPAGMHKHFRIIAIRDYMVSQGLNGLEDQHMTISGIWKKLESLYDLSKLDDREDSVANDGIDEGGEVVAYWRDFELPRDDYEALMWDRRLAPEGTSSPEWSRRGSTVADSEEPRSSPVSVRGSTRGGRRGRGGRLSKLQNEVETERSSRRTSKAGSVKDEDQVMNDVDEEEEEHESSEDSNDESEEQEDEDRKGSGKRRGRNAKRARGRRGRGRGRG